MRRKPFPDRQLTRFNLYETSRTTRFALSRFTSL